MTNEQDELIDVRLPRNQYNMLREVLEREMAYSWLTNRLRSLWIYGVAAGLVTLLTFGDRIKDFFIK